MSRDKLLVEQSIYFMNDDRLELRETTKYRDEITKAVRITLDTRDKMVRDALVKLGWTPPVVPVKASDEVEIGRRLDEIRVANPRVNLSYIDADRVLIGGVLNAKELRALSDLMAAVKP